MFPAYQVVGNVQAHRSPCSNGIGMSQRRMTLACRPDQLSADAKWEWQSLNQKWRALSGRRLLPWGGGGGKLHEPRLETSSSCGSLRPALVAIVGAKA